ncbi:MAG: hypothetical protein R6W78_01930 [Bacteroidales bacterium]
MKTTIKHRQIKVAATAFIATLFFIELTAQNPYILTTAERNLKQLKSYVIVEINQRNSGLKAIIASSSNMPDAIKADMVAFYPDIEENIKIEPWMLTESHFLGLSRSKPDITEELEQYLPIEEWMLDTMHFMPSKKFTDPLTEEEEKTLYVEDWMLDTGHFNTHTANVR